MPGTTIGESRVGRIGFGDIGIPGGERVLGRQRARSFVVPCDCENTLEEVEKFVQKRSWFSSKVFERTALVAAEREG